MFRKNKKSYHICNEAAGVSVLHRFRSHSPCKKPKGETLHHVNHNTESNRITYFKIHTCKYSDISTKWKGRGCEVQRFY